MSPAPLLMQFPSSHAVFEQEIDVGTSLRSEHLDDAAGPQSAVRIVVPRIVRPTPREDASPAMKARLLAVAAEHLRCLGSNGVTVRAVAAEVGLTHPSVYRYFTSKASLLDAVAGQWLVDVEAQLTRIVDASDAAGDKIEHLLTALASIQHEALIDEPHLFAIYLDATVAARPIARCHRVRLRNLVERVVEDGIATNAFVARDPERAIAYIFDASYRFTHPLAIQQDAGVPRDLMDARLGTVILAIQKTLRAGTL